MAIKLPCFKTPNPIRYLDRLPNIDYRNRRSINRANLSTTESVTVELLDAWEDDYDGVIINSQRLPNSSNAFSSALQFSVSHWKLMVGILLSYIAQNDAWLSLHIIHCI